MLASKNTATARRVGVFIGAYLQSLHTTLDTRGTQGIRTLRILKGSLTMNTKQSIFTTDAAQVMKPNMTNFEMEAQAQLLNHGELGVTLISNTWIGQVGEGLFSIVIALKERHVRITVNVEWELS